MITLFCTSGNNDPHFTTQAESLFCELADQSGMDIFCVFDSPNYVTNVVLVMEAGRSGTVS